MSGYRRMCNSKTRLVGKTIVITGFIGGTKKEVARDLYRRGARVILASRDITGTNAVAEELKTVLPSKREKKQYNGNPGEIAVCELDISSFTSVRKCAKCLTDTEANIHVLINSAVAEIGPFEKTEDGFEYQLQINYLSHFLLTLLLLPKLKSSDSDAKIINISSDLHHDGNINFGDINLEKSYTPLKAYCQSKLANILFTRELARRLKDARIEGISVYSLHSDFREVGSGRYLDSVFLRTVQSIRRPFVRPISNVSDELRAQTILYCALDEEAAEQTGLYYKNCSVATTSDRARNDELARHLWNESLKYVGLEPKDNLADMLDTLSRTVASFQPPQEDEQMERNSPNLSEISRRFIGSEISYRLRRLFQNKYEPL